MQAVTGPLLKWPGGKSRELERILPRLLPVRGRYLDPFVGGGATLFGVPAEVPAAVNDASTELMGLYRCVQAGAPALLRPLRAFAAWWEELSAWAAAVTSPAVTAYRREGAAVAAELPLGEVVEGVPGAWRELEAGLWERLRAGVADKVSRMRANEQRRGRMPPGDVAANLEAAVKAAVYGAVRDVYNRGRRDDAADPRQAARFWVVRELCYGSMFRFNQRGEYNVPYGGITYNRKDLAVKVAHLAAPAVQRRLAACRIACGDFEPFLEEAAPRPDDVLFLDPPYDSTFSSYDGRDFDLDDHRRLAACMRRFPCRCLLVIRATPDVRDIYTTDGWSVEAFDKTYDWTVKDRNDRQAVHLVIGVPPVR